MKIAETQTIPMPAVYKLLVYKQMKNKTLFFFLISSGIYGEDLYHLFYLMSSGFYNEDLYHIFHLMSSVLYNQALYQSFWADPYNILLLI